MRASINSGSIASNSTVYNDPAKPKSTQPAHSFINHRHRDDLTELFDRTRVSTEIPDELQITKKSLRKAEELCAIRCMNATMRISTLEHSNKTLAAKVEDLVAQVEQLTLLNNKPKCADCSTPFTPAKKSYKKCPECFLSLKHKLRKNCSKPFKPKHHSFKYCPCCSKK